MTKEIKGFGNNEIEKRKFHYCKTSILLEDVDIGNILISGMVSCGEKITKMMIIKLIHCI